MCNLPKGSQLSDAEPGTAVNLFTCALTFEVLRSSSIWNCSSNLCRIGGMEPTMVSLPEDLDVRLRSESERTGVSVAEMTRQAIEEFPESPREQRELMAAGAGASGRSDISERIEEILTKEVNSSL